MITTTNVVAIAIAGIALTGCCLKKVTLTPEMSTVDLKAATAGNAKLGVDIAFKECCPSESQKALALEMQTNVASLYRKLVAGDVKLAEYNEKVKAAKDSIETVILVCNASESRGGGGLMPRSAAPPRGLSLEDAWTRVADVNRRLR